jgi:hypothetical protein
MSSSTSGAGTGAASPEEKKIEMPYQEVDPTLWRRQIRRTLLNGSPNSGKSTSLRTWPVGAGLTVVSAPMEKGVSSVPLKNFEGKPIKHLVYSVPDVAAAVKWTEVVNDFRNTVFAEGKRLGEEGGLVVEGLHHVHRMFTNEVTFGAASAGTDFDPKLWGNAHSRFFTFLDQLQKLPCAYVVATVWDGLEKDNPDEKGSNPSRHVFPDLPGGAAKRVMGEWSCSFNATKEGENYVWVTKPRGQIWGAAAKLPLEISSKIPNTIPQDWVKFEQNVLKVAEGGEWGK